MSKCKLNHDLSIPWYLQNRHLQTIYHKVARRNPLLPPAEEWHIPLNSQGNLEGKLWPGESKKKLVVIYHGLGGDADSEYIVGLGLRVLQAGFSVLRMNLRGAEQAPTCSPFVYHSGLIEDFTRVLNVIKAQGYEKTYWVGFSLTGNMLLKWLAQEERPLEKVFVVSPPVRLTKCVELIDAPRNRFYRWYFLRKLEEIVAKKATVFPERFSSLLEKKNFVSLRSFDENITAALNGYKNADDYYERSSSYQELTKIRNRVAIVHARDDPFVDSEDLEILFQNCPPNLEVGLLPQGGHVGFFEGPRKGYAVDRWVTEYFSAP